MILPKFKIFIVYSSRYKNITYITKVIIDEINNAYRNSFIPVESLCVDNDTLAKGGSEHLWDTICENMNKADGAIILYTPDNMQDDHYIPRANVILEMGMLFHSLPRDKIWILRFGDAKPITDIEGIIYHNVGDDLASIKECIHTYLAKYEFAINENPLSNEKYKPNYTDYKKIGYLNNDILDNFINDLDNIEQIDQKIIFIAERLIFTGVIRAIYYKLIDRISSYYNNDEIINNCLYILENVLEYLMLTQKKRNNYNTDNELIEEYMALNETWSKMVNWLNNLKTEINPLIPLLCFDYAALTLHKIILYGFKNLDKDYVRILIEKAIDYYNKAQGYIMTLDNVGENLWEGYVSFDLARLYECELIWYQKYDNQNDKLKQAIQQCMKYYNRTIYIRRKWYKHIHNKFPRILSIEFQCEYFYAYADYINSLIIIEGGCNKNIKIKIDAISNEFEKWKHENIDRIHDLMSSIENKFKKIHDVYLS